MTDYLTDPQSGDVAYFDCCVEGGDPYRVVISYTYFPEEYRFGWYNISNPRLSLFPEGNAKLSKLHLLVRNGHTWKH